MLEDLSAQGYVRARIDGETFEQLCRRIDTNVAEERSGRKTAADREYDLFTLLPRAVLAWAPGLLKRLDHYGLLPGWFIEGDGMYTSVFIANLGSVGLDAAYHHLFEYGTVPIFVTMGRVHRAPVVHPNGEVGSHEVFVLRYTYDERIEDGFYAARALDQIKAELENPEKPARPAS